MPVVRIALVMLCFAGLIAPASGAAQKPQCFSNAQQRAAVADKRAIPLARARESLGGTGSGDTIQARLCQGQNSLVYMLTLLPRNGKVQHVTIDAATGAILSRR